MNETNPIWLRRAFCSSHANTISFSGYIDQFNLFVDHWDTHGLISIVCTRERTSSIGKLWIWSLVLLTYCTIKLAQWTNWVMGRLRKIPIQYYIFGIRNHRYWGHQWGQNSYSVRSRPAVWSALPARPSTTARLSQCLIVLVNRGYNLFN
jgi:hypothetical protein